MTNEIKLPPLSDKDFGKLLGLARDYRAYERINGPLGTHGEKAQQDIVDFVNRLRREAVEAYKSQQALTGVASRKLVDLESEGWSVGGVHIQKRDGDTWRHGAVTNSGKVLWWHDGDQPAQQQADTIARGMHWEDTVALCREACEQAGFKWDSVTPTGVNVLQRLANNAHRVGFVTALRRLGVQVEQPQLSGVGKLVVDKQSGGQDQYAGVERLTAENAKLRNAAEELLSNEEHRFSGGMSEYQVGSPTWELWEQLRKAVKETS